MLVDSICNFFNAFIRRRTGAGRDATYPLDCKIKTWFYIKRDLCTCPTSFPKPFCIAASTAGFWKMGLEKQTVEQKS